HESANAHSLDVPISRETITLMLILDPYLLDGINRIRQEKILSLNAII
ncbi:unnamed protein product, partial [marine sediment metagenome]